MALHNSIAENSFLLLGYQLRKTLSTHGSVSRGVCSIDEDMSLIRVKEHTKLEIQNNRVIDLESGNTFSGSEFVSMNFWVCQTSIFEQIENDIRLFLKTNENLERGEVYLPFAIQNMLDKKETEVLVIPAGEDWFGVTYASDKKMAVNSLKNMTDEGFYPKSLWQ